MGAKKTEQATAGAGAVRPHVVRSFTLRNLAKNRACSIVTIMGIALSCALLAAVLLCVSSLTAYMRDVELARDGAWMASVTTTDEDAIAQARSDGRVSGLTDLTYVGQMQSFDAGKEDPTDAVAAQLQIQAIDSNLTQLCTIQLCDGRLPQNSHEIVLNKKYQGTTELTDQPCELGSTFSGELALRSLAGDEARRFDLCTGFGGFGEEGLVPSGVEASYTVVGFYDTDWSATLTWSGGDSALVLESGQVVAPSQSYDGTVVASIQAFSPAFTYADADLVTAQGALGEEVDHTVYLATQGISTVGDLVVLVESYLGTDITISTHDSLLRCLFMTDSRSLWETLYQLAGIVCAIIVIASASLIFNAFAISVAERTRQFGLLSSIGASKRQIRAMVFWEALALAVVGIPAGLLLGVVGSAVVLDFISEPLTSTLGGADFPVPFALAVDPVSLVAAAVLALVVVMLSAWVPSRRAASVSAVEALRNVNDVRLSRRQLRRARSCASDPWKPRSFEVGAHILGVPGALASRSASRGPAKARVASASLAIAIVLFVTAGSFGDALKAIAGATTEEYDYDISVSAYSDQDGDVSRAQAVYQELCNVGGVQGKGAIALVSLPASMPVPMAGDDAYGYDDGTGAFQYQASLVFVDDEAYRTYLDQLGLNADEYLDASHPKALAYNETGHNGGVGYANLHEYAGTGTVSLFSYDLPAEASARGPLYESLYASDGSYAADAAGVWEMVASEYEYSGSSDEGASSEGSGADSQANASDTSQTVRYPRSEYAKPLADIEVGAVVDEKPQGMSLNVQAGLIVPMSFAKTLFGQDNLAAATIDGGSLGFAAYFDADDPAQATSAMYNVMNDSDFLGYSFFNVDEQVKSQTDMVTVVNTLSYSFAIILALVAVANVFNTLVSSLLLRQREFAVLQSVGMSRAGVRRMVMWECVRFGARGLICGMAVSFVVALLLHRAMQLSFRGLGFTMPWASVAIAFAVCILVTLLACAYGLKHAKTDNVVEALRMQ